MGPTWGRRGVGVLVGVGVVFGSMWGRLGRLILRLAVNVFFIGSRTHHVSIWFPSQVILPSARCFWFRMYGGVASLPSSAVVPSSLRSCSPTFLPFEPMWAAHGCSSLRLLTLVFLSRVFALAPLPPLSCTSVAPSYSSPLPFFFRASPRLFLSCVRRSRGLFSRQAPRGPSRADIRFLSPPFLACCGRDATEEAGQPQAGGEA